MAKTKTDTCAPGVHRLLTLMVNVYLVDDGTGGWTLIDAGMRGYAGTIRRAARRLFGSRPPSAIVLTHGHFDHVGALPRLARDWGVPVYAHPLELPYLTGRSSYAPPDPTVGGGLWSRLSAAFPKAPTDLGPMVSMLPSDGRVPTLPGWRWIHTPGHTAGHVSLFRDEDRVLVAGDAFVTTRQESFVDVLTQREVVWRPPAYFTADWEAARRSVQRLADLEPDVAATGHGTPLRGRGMRDALRDLARRFDEVMPRHGRYVREPALADERGIVHLPPRRGFDRGAVALGAAIAAGVSLGLAMSAHGGRSGR